VLVSHFLVTKTGQVSTAMAGPGAAVGHREPAGGARQAWLGLRSGGGQLRATQLGRIPVHHTNAAERLRKACSARLGLSLSTALCKLIADG
jgi:hypothetical protein